MLSTEDFLAYYRRQRSWTRTLVAAVPEEHFGWRPAETAFSAGELVRHLIQSEGFWVKMIQEAVEGRSYDPFGIPGPGRRRMEAFRRPNLESAGRAVKRGATFAECLAGWVPIQERTEAELARLTPEQLATVEVEHPLMALRMPLWESLLTMVGHEVYHRGQLSAYLKMIGAEQPAVLG
ncbi:MAG: DinB family protein [Thermoanaerobaculia bacterium]